MLSEEEKEALERLNKRYEFFKENPLATNVWLTLDIHNLGIALNLIEKQSKEIEELKQEKEYLNCIIESDKDNYINKDKIKAKIEEIDEVLKGQLIEKIRVYFEAQKEVLQSLLEKE